MFLMWRWKALHRLTLNPTAGRKHLLRVVSLQQFKDGDGNRVVRAGGEVVHRIFLQVCDAKMT